MSKKSALILHYPVWCRSVLWVEFVLLIPGVPLLALLSYARLLRHDWLLGGVMGALVVGVSYLMIRSGPALWRMNIRAELTSQGVQIRAGYPARLVSWQEFGDVRQVFNVRHYQDRQGNEIFTLFNDVKGRRALDAELERRAQPCADGDEL